MTMESVMSVLQWLFVIYLLLMTLGYIVLNVLALRAVAANISKVFVEQLPQSISGLEPPVSLLVPAYNESATIVSSVNSMLQLDYPEFEILVINDGSKDDTLQRLIDAFDLVPQTELPRTTIATKPVRRYYRSRHLPNLRVIDKQNGGKADSLNAGINSARYPLFCAVDADSILQRDSLTRVIRPFLYDPLTVASGGTVRIANGCEVRDGLLTRVGLPRNPLALLQVVEYLRAFLFGRLGWHPINGLLIISGAFGVFKRSVVEEVGGYRADTVGEDMELVVRIHHRLREAGRPYRISFVPDPICWTEAPESLRILGSQRSRWHRGLSDSLWMNRQLLFSKKGGVPGWAAFPFALLFEWLSPLIELSGYVVMALGFLFGWISAQAMLAFLFVAIGLGIMLSITALLLEEMSFHVYPRSRQTWALLAAAVLENFGYRQINCWWRLRGLWQWYRGKEGWGTMVRKGTWQAGGTPPK